MEPWVFGRAGWRPGCYFCSLPAQQQPQPRIPCFRTMTVGERPRVAPSRFAIESHSQAGFIPEHKRAVIGFVNPMPELCSNARRVPSPHGNTAKRHIPTPCHETNNEIARTSARSPTVSSREGAKDELQYRNWKEKKVKMFLVLSKAREYH